MIPPHLALPGYLRNVNAMIERAMHEDDNWDDGEILGMGFGLGL